MPLPTFRRGVNIRGPLLIHDEVLDATAGELNALSPAELLGKNVYFVDTAVTASGVGTSWATAFKTMAEAAAVLAAGDMILFRGSILNEAVTITGLAGISIIGAGSGPNQALWTSTVADSACLTLAACPDALIENIRFRPTAGAGATLTAAAISLTGASFNVVIRSCRFQGKTGSYHGILSDGAQSNVRVEDCAFFYINTATYGTAIKIKAHATLECTGWAIRGNEFHGNLNHIVGTMRSSIIRDNVFSEGGINPAGAYALTVLGVDLHGSTIGGNIVTGNFMGGLYHQACYYGATNDQWAGNNCVDRSHATQVDATTGISKLVPAA